MTLMHGFPPAADDQVTLANWRTAPFNQWAFHHVREIVPSADIPNDPTNVMTLPELPIDFAEVQLNTGCRSQSFDDFLLETNTDGLVVLHRGKIVFESYANGMAADTPHILMSVSKSLLGLIFGILSAHGVIDLERTVTDFIPEMSNTAYRGATIRQLLDMRAGVAFDEDYLAVSGPIIEYRKATNWNPLAPGETASDLRSFYRSLTQPDGPHGGRFHYISPNTDLLGWVIERAAGQRFADLMSELIWRPMGAEHNAYITVDRLGAPRCAGGICATTRDLARVGQFIVEGGARNSAQIIPQEWIDDLVRNGSEQAWNDGPFTSFFPGEPMHYRGKWYVQKGTKPLLFGLGVFGQNLFVDRQNEIVIAKFSSQAPPLDAELIQLTMQAVGQIRQFLSAS